MPTLSRGALEREGFEVIERRQPSLLAGGILITGEVDRVTEFERGMPPSHQAWDSRGWQHDPAVIDDQALVINVHGRGLVIVTGCGHAGVVNIIRHAMRLTGVSRLLAVIGGFHLSGPAFEPVIEPTVAARRGDKQGRGAEQPADHNARLPAGSCRHSTVIARAVPTTPASTAEWVSARMSSG
jgi:7,8-dihydropterin-6-yl-methyl-4-(beta-D-ribofuranosyl)aminobenzene 5'-phosphate synthase